MWKYATHTKGGRLLTGGETGSRPTARGKMGKKQLCGKVQCLFIFFAFFLVLCSNPILNKTCLLARLVSSRHYVNCNLHDNVTIVLTLREVLCCSFSLEDIQIFTSFKHIRNHMNTYVCTWPAPQEIASQGQRPAATVLHHLQSCLH